MLNIVIFGAPGSGKGTQSELLIEKYGLHHISTGELLREEAALGTELGKKIDSFISKGNFVPDDLIIEMLKKYLKDKPVTTGIILDGFPRTLVQGMALNDILGSIGRELSIVINLQVDEQELVDRLLNRGKMSGRSDDNLSVIASRLQIYKTLTAPLLDFYTQEGKLVNINGGKRSIQEIFADIDRAVSEVYQKALAC